jgi:hypothetical protein
MQERAAHQYSEHPKRPEQTKVYNGAFVLLRHGAHGVKDTARSMGCKSESVN